MVHIHMFIHIKLDKLIFKNKIKFGNILAKKAPDLDSFTYKFYQTLKEKAWQWWPVPLIPALWREADGSQ